MTEALRTWQFRVLCTALRGLIWSLPGTRGESVLPTLESMTSSLTRVPVDVEVVLLLPRAQGVVEPKHDLLVRAALPWDALALVIELPVG